MALFTCRRGSETFVAPAMISLYDADTGVSELSAFRPGVSATGVKVVDQTVVVTWADGMVTAHRWQRDGGFAMVPVPQ
jgi:hypothetical protein